MKDIEKHLEFIQNVITRMARNSFFVKGWSVTLIAALFVLAAGDTDGDLIAVAFLPAIFFWVLDAYYLYQERVFRRLYDRVRTSEHEMHYSMDTTEDDGGVIDWIKTAFSKTILIFHIIIVMTVIVAFVNV